MAHEATIEQLIAQVHSLSEDQVSALNSVTVPVDEVVKALEIPGIEDETRLQMSQLGEDTDPGVWAIARVAILGILSQGNPAVDSALLIRVWTDVITPFHTDTLVEIEQSEVFDVTHGLVQDPLPIVEPVVEVPVAVEPVAETPVVVEPVVEAPVVPSEPVVEVPAVVEPVVEAAPVIDPAAGAI